MNKITIDLWKPIGDYVIMNFVSANAIAEASQANLGRYMMIQRRAMDMIFRSERGV
jgi:p-aminobenzoyl-glutamate transporter AbgT